MPRPRKCRKECKMPVADTFVSNSAKVEAVVLTVDEYECNRLVDYQGFSKEQCAECTIRIDDGDYHLCDGMETHCGYSGCQKHCQRNDAE